LTIKIHRWTCDKCDDKLFLRVDDENPLQLIRLTKFEAYATKHIIEMDHEMTHIEKEEKGFNII